MAHPDNQQQEDEDGGTFKLKPGAQSQPEAPAAEENLDSTMVLRKAGGASTPPPPPPSPLGNPTGPSNPQPSPFAETSVMPQTGGSQTGFQPATQAPGQSNPLGQPTPPPQQQAQQPYGQQQQQQQPYGQQPPGGQYPPQQGGPYGQPGGAQGEAPEGIKRIGLVALIGAGMGLLGSIVSLAILGGIAIFSSSISILLALAFGWYGYSLPRGQVRSSGLRMTGVILMMVFAGLSLLGVLGGFTSFAVIGGIAVLPLVLNIITAGIYGYASFIYLTDDAVKAYIKGTPTPQQAAGGAVPPPAAPGQPGAYPPPPGHPQQGHQGQPPYGR